jgi:hypothetical protein
MSESWTISIGDRIYGPYTFEQMRAFHAEKRLAAHSLVARAGEEQFRLASEDPEFAVLFQPSEAPASAPPEAEAAPRFGGRPQLENADGPSHFVIVADMKSRSIAGLEDEIVLLGKAHRFGPQAWVLSSEASLNTVRIALVQKLGKLDTLFIVDAARDRAAWFNFGPETDTRIRRIWSRPSEYAGTEKRSATRA